MKFYKCEMPNCGEYITEDELKQVKYNGRVINICTLCDDGSFEPVNGGEHYESTKKIEKIRRKRRKEDQ